MKALKAVLCASLVLVACEKSDNITQVHDEAVAIAKFYGPRVDDLAKRRDAIFQRGRNVPGNMPDVPEIVRLIGEAGDKINEMKGVTTSIEKQADDAAKAKKLDELSRLVDESHEKLDADWVLANDDLTRVEGWLWQFEQARGTPAAPPKETPLPTPNETGEPPPAAAGTGAGSAAKADKTIEKAPKTDKIDKAAQKAATEKADKGTPKEDKAPPKAEKAPAKAAGSGAGSAK